MLVLVATRHTQGQFEGDYCHAVDGELVTPVTVECCLPHSCGCGRGFAGLVSAHATTTAMVVDRSAITHDVLRQSVGDSLDRSGATVEVLGDEFTDLVDEHLDTVRRVCSAFGEGVVVRRDGPAFWADVERSAA